MSTKKVKKERIVKQISFRDHVRTRSMWAGNKHSQDLELYVHEKGRFVPKLLHYSQVLYKIIDEIVVNALDHHKVFPDDVTDLNITIKDDVIIVTNNGPGINIVETITTSGVKMYAPQMIFSEQMAGSNFDDDETTERIVGGQNGIGAKLATCFSTFLEVDTVDAIRNLRYTQRFLDGMSIVEPPKIEPVSKKTKPFTTITFKPDYAEFKIDPKSFLPTLHTIIETRAWFVAACSNLNVTFNDKLIDLGKKNRFEQFCSMFVDKENTEQFGLVPLMTFTLADEKYPWDVCISLTDGKEQNLSIVNGVIIASGGTHIKHIQNTILDAIKSDVEKEFKKYKQKFNKNVVLNNLFIFMNGSIPNPTFLSQTKDTISNAINTFKSYEIDARTSTLLWNYLQSPILNAIASKQIGESKRTSRKKIVADKYREAQNCRNPKKALECTLIIAEGDSAIGTAKEGLQSGISANFNYEYFGYFSVQGVIVNGLKESVSQKDVGKITRLIKSRDAIDNDVDKQDDDSKSIQSESSALASAVHMTCKRIANKKVNDSERLMTLMQVLGLDWSKTFDFTPKGEKEWKGLRYGAIAGLTDQDLDGFNIFGLIATFFLTYWPNLVKRGFIKRIQTPLIRAYPSNKKYQVISFYSERQLATWRDANPDADKIYTYEYYKGLASHDKGKGEINDMFKNIDKKICLYTLDEEAIEKMYVYYGPDTAPRKVELATNVSRIPIDGLQIPLSQHFEIDSKLYQRDNIIRKLLSCIDGLVVSRRKVLFTARRHGRSKTKVATLGSDVVSQANYHHGEASIAETITKMAQAYAGARNLPLLMPIGMFGTRSQGYKDSGQPRYIYTQLNTKLVDKLFRPEDDYILDYDVDDGKRYEPKYYVPIIPYALCETNELPATGWAINVQARHIDDVMKNVFDRITGKTTKCTKLRQWNRSFIGDIRIVKDREYTVGKYVFDKKANKVEITELPFGVYSEPYCLEMSKKELVEDIIDNTSEETINIVIELKADAYQTIDAKYGNQTFDSIEEYFELKRPLYHRLNLLNQYNEVVEFKRYEDIFDTWYNFRKELYAIRVDRELIINDLYIQMLKNMQRFSQYHDEYNITKNTTEEKFHQILTEEKYQIFNVSLLDNPRYTELHLLREYIIEEKHGANYEYIMRMTYRDLTTEAYAKRAAKIKELETRQLYLSGTDEQFKGARIWIKELEELSAVIKLGLETKWRYGEHTYKFADGTPEDIPMPKKLKQKKI